MTLSWHNNADNQALIRMRICSLSLAPTESPAASRLSHKSRNPFAESLGYDYFRVQWNVGYRILRIPVPNNVVERAMPYTSDRKEWVLCGPHSLNRWLP